MKELRQAAREYVEFISSANGEKLTLKRIIESHNNDPRATRVSSPTKQSNGKKILSATYTIELGNGKETKVTIDRNYIKKRCN